MRRARVAPLLAALVVADAVHATTLRVPEDYPTIQSAVTAAGVADTVLVACGTYFEHNISILKPIVIRSASGVADCVTIDAGNVGSVFFCVGSSNLTLNGITVVHSGSSAVLFVEGRGVTLTDCVFADNRGANGGALFISRSDGPYTVNVERCELLRNEATSRGGALYCPVNGGTTIRDSRFFANVADGGGAVTVGGPAVVANCLFEGNSAGTGGAVYTDERVDLTGCSFANNDATGEGGGALAFVGDGEGFAGAAGCVFEGNTASRGGAVLMLGTEIARMIDCRFSGNSAEKGGAVGILDANGRLESCLLRDNVAKEGGAVHVTFGFLGATGTSFFRNVASLAGGAVWLDLTSDATISGSTLCMNGSSGVGGGIAQVGGPASELSLLKTIIAFSAPGEAVHRQWPSPSAYITCTDIFGNAGGDWVGFLHAHEGINNNFSADPRFCDTTQGVLTLNSDSPCASDLSPDGCGLVGALDVGCGPVSTEPASWAAIKARFK